ncbi:DUF3558 domain-containing protein [Corynebacterium propinquum]|uniref:DUF3558 family protein n=2 Tax=Corynebacterium propinquum TaxID=43769 RepID=A0AAP4F6I3_9CORY|nr:DUF3558 family protein [Corynebacterium propinquum]MCG7232341.1 DUF3558 domain-containing protein [Corynebacterium propinquum]MDK4251186.1 DUF3558 family protein [Corynebacterium propinquum]MDK4303663.1 DUF3558 family protein [Corynebacterium propinquum]MDK4325555.1 DUF3558 family protein [Corynebacterium propinquum]WKS27174.1 DUF3558 domain-containing protein [Corynebacterium propinquum]
MSWNRIGLATTVLTGVFVAGCSPNSASTDAQGGLSHDSDKTAETGSAAREDSAQNSSGNVEFADWVPERGPTDRHAPGFELFNLCDEAPDEVWEKAGLHFHPELSETTDLGTHITCFRGMSADRYESYPTGEAGNLAITVDDYSKAELEEDREILDIPIESKLPGVHFRELIDSNECTAGLETVSGRINVGDSGKDRGLSMQESCKLALDYLEIILLK